jgi:tubulin polyglutamylase TTLL9
MYHTVYLTDTILFCRWLIEINASPSLTASGKEDYELKFGLLSDLINVLDLENR